MIRLARLCAQCALLVCATGTASAQSASAFTPGIGVEAQVGLGTPLGFGGVGVDLNLLEPLSLNAGVGVGSDGPQLALMGRARWTPNSAAAASGYTGLGASVGPYLAGPDCDAVVCDSGAELPREQWDAAVWANLELGVEQLVGAEHSVSFRGYVGLGRLLNPGGSELSTDYCAAGSPCGGFNGIPMQPWLIYVGMAVGYRTPW